MNQTLAFIILNYNDSASTISLVDSLCNWKQDNFQIRIIIVDNRSKDNSYTLLKERYSTAFSVVDVVESERNGGYSYGNNFGVRYAITHYSPDYIAIANPDIEVDENTVSECLKTFNAAAKLGGVSPVMCNINGHYSISASRLPKYSDDLMLCFNDCFSRTIIRENFNYLNGKSNMILTETLPGSLFLYCKNSNFLKNRNV